MTYDWTDAIREAHACAPAHVVILNTLELAHPSFQTLYLVRDLQGHRFRLENGQYADFEKAAFRFALPPVGDNGIQELNLQFDNTDRRISTHMDAVISNPDPIQVTFRAYLNINKEAPQATPLVLLLRDLRLTATDVTCRASFADLVNRPFLAPVYSTRRFAGLA